MGEESASQISYLNNNVRECHKFGKGNILQDRESTTHKRNYWKIETELAHEIATM